MEKIENFEEFDAKVDKFLRHQMTAEEEQAFKSEIALDDEKRSRARITALMVKTMQQEGLKYDQDIINDIRDLNEINFREALGLKPRSLNLRPSSSLLSQMCAFSMREELSYGPRVIKYLIAACVVGIISLGGYHYYEYNQTISLGNSQYMAYISDISETSSVRGSTDETILIKLEKLFANVKESNNLNKTIEELEALYEDSFVESSEYAEYQDDISWNLAIAYLKNGEREKPIPILEKMVKRNINYPEIARPAQKLIDQIKEL